MEISVILAEKIAELFLIMMMGFVLVKAGLLKSSDSRIISVILVYLITPCMIIHSFQITATSEVISGLTFSFLTAFAVHILFIVFTEIFRKVTDLSVIEQLTLIYTNAGILVIPLVESLLGSEYVIYSSGFIAVQQILLWTHCRGKLCGDGSGIQWKKLILNINVLSMLAGGLLFALQIHLPELLGDTMETTGGMIGPMGMLLAGMLLADTSLRKVFARGKNYIPAVLRLLVFPALLLLLFKLTGISSMISDGKNILLVVFLACATPACATVTSMAQLYGGDAQYSSVLYALTTVLSIVTMPVMIGMYTLLI